MSLNFRLDQIENYKTLCWVPIGDGTDDVQIAAKTDRCIWGCFRVGIGVITNENHEEWFARYRFFEELYHERQKLTLDDVKAHIGLTTNVSSEPRRSWEKRIKTNAKGGD